MPSRDGFETWLEYEVALSALLILAAITVGAGRILVALLRQAPLTTVELVLYGGLVLLAGSFGALRWLNR
ncbi:hypothetical protein [Salarchaeum japonicum]|uniref:Uncharacterized protein n=1 Tax=Salarchaeum japonicum TaxID=555573 RepID=A0AAV3T4U6_9EURY|nr:hypothetical protein [Salarchaeum japonicum]